MAWMRRRFAVLACVLGVAILSIGISAASGAKLQTRSASTSIGPASQGATTAACKPGTKAVSGGFEFVPSEPSPFFLFPTASQREGARKWTSGGTNSTDDPVTLISYAYCRDQRVKSVAETIELDPAADASLTATCPAGMKAVSGGFEAEDDDDTVVFVRASHKQGKRGWVVIAIAFGTDPGTLRAQVNCHDGKKLKTRSQTEIAAGIEDVDAIARCKRNQRVVSGGFETENFVSKGGPFVHASRKHGRRRWLVTTLDTGSETFTSYAYCEKKRAKEPRPVGVRD
jgi:hypothetical protein